MKVKQQKFVVDLEEEYPPKILDLIGEDIVEQIKVRTESGQGVKKSGKYFTLYKFPKYSAQYAGGIDPKTGKKYKPSLDFRIAGKNKNSVDLTLSGEMLASIEVLNKTKSKLEIGYPADDTELNGKVDGNQRGTYGQDKPIRGKARSFLGITPTELDNILKKYDDYLENETLGRIERKSKKAIRESINFIEKDKEDEGE